MMQRLVVLGWLLVTYHGGTIAWYETEKDCLKTAVYLKHMYDTGCAPDRYEFEEGGSLYVEPKK